jgi:hypothetical protein
MLQLALLHAAALLAPPSKANANLPGNCVTHIDAPHVWQHPIPAPTLERARSIFEDVLMPQLVEDGLISELEKKPIPCTELDTAKGSYFVMRGGSSTNEKLRDSSDLSWISVNDESTFEVFRGIFEETGVAEALAPLIDGDDVRLYSCFYVVRSRCASPNFHTDWPDAVGNNAFTLLTPLEDYDTDGFQLLYKTTQGEVKQYRYRAGEAICFSSHFVHSTEPGRARSGDGPNPRPHVFLCFTFGSDKVEHWPAIAPTINGYQSRFLRRYDGASELTEIGRYLQDVGR